MKAKVWKVPVLTAGQYAYLVKFRTRLPIGGSTPEITDIFFVTEVEEPLKYRGALLGTDGVCRLVCVHNNNGAYHLKRRYKGEENVIHYDLMQVFSERRALAFICGVEETIRDDARKAAELVDKFQRAKLMFLTASRTFRV
ncbi:hypothetical protein C4556_03030 [Candidatus Parcubacteria bacterium]|nr:MAG: hypothetical protein C4556_03030 [Candidatus Parcubacteria bacterium]